MQWNWLTLLAGATLTAGLPIGLAAGAGQQSRVLLDPTAHGLPSGFMALSSRGEPSRWQVQEIDGVPALTRLGISRGSYQLAVLEVPRLGNLRAGVRLRMGPGDQAAGLAWRVQDSGNYYAARLDFVDDEIVLYKFVRGNRVELEDLSGLQLDEDAWHTLTIQHVGDMLRVWLNGVPVATERERSVPTAGLVGVWMPSDSTASFADLWYEAVGPEPE